MTKKSNKNARTNANINTNEVSKSSLIKRLKIRHPDKNKISKKKSRRKVLNKEKIIKNYLDAQSAVKLQCCICFKNICNQIKIILEPISPNKNTFFQKDLFFNALCINCFIFKTNFDSKNEIYYTENEYTLVKYKFRDYRILAKMSDPLFTEDWSLGDEIKLLGAVERLGIENWDEISKIINKGKFECKSHYYTFYYKDKNDYLINDKEVNINNKSKDIFIENKVKENNLLFDLTQNIGYIPFSEKNNNKSKCLINKNNNNNNKNEEKRIINRSMYNNLGYWFKRNEFDIEYNNEAEILLSELEFKDNDNYETYNNNYKLLQYYNNILDEREEMKQLICEKNLFDIKKQINFEKKISNEDKEIYTNIKYNVKLLTKEKYSDMYEKYVFEKNIGALLNQFYMYKNLGCKNHEDILNYLIKRKKEKLIEDEKIKI